MTIGFTNKPTNAGGPSTFQINLTNYLKQNNINVTHDLNDKDLEYIIVLASTSKIFSLIKCKYRKVKIVHRLDGINYKSIKKVKNIKLYLYLKTVNILMYFIRKYLSDIIIYQSDFSKNWWNKVYGKENKKTFVIRNGADVKYIQHKKIQKKYEIICIEGNYDDIISLNYIEKTYLSLNKNIFSKFHIIGNTSKYFSEYFSKYKDIIIHGHIPRDEINNYRNINSIQLSVDFNTACPNSIIEGMMHGVPIIGIDTGSLKELVGNKAGIICDYNGNSFKMDLPIDYANIGKSAELISRNYIEYSNNANIHAIRNFTIEKMGKNYLKAINWYIN